MDACWGKECEQTVDCFWEATAEVPEDLGPDHWVHQLQGDFQGCDLGGWKRATGAQVWLQVEGHWLLHLVP